ncbi:MAG: hypothetical protein DLM72_15830 [Candidatus Nitrosopolaris wilkensis]|nr:MAG: hypothetical protein DLM72_15830 [Candidatus Nitrosopolaris wilkensis]
MKTRNATASHLTISIANWLVENEVSGGNYSILEYRFPYPPYNMTSPRHSGMAQGQGIQSLADT